VKLRGKSRREWHPWKDKLQVWIQEVKESIHKTSQAFERWRKTRGEVRLKPYEGHVEEKVTVEIICNIQRTRNWVTLNVEHQPGCAFEELYLEVKASAKKRT
jgi:hypothetical protein